MIKADLEQMFKPLVQELGYELWGCEYLAQGKHSLLRIYIDKQEGIAVEDCEIVSRQVSALLDVEDPLPGNYTLEVSSPGVPRPLFYQWQYEHYLGSEVQLKLFKPVANRRKLTGTIVSVTDSALVLDVENEHHEILFSIIVKANLTV